MLSTTGCLTPCCCPGEWERGLHAAVSSPSVAQISGSISCSTQQRLPAADGAFLELLFTLKLNDCIPNTSHQRPCQSSLKCHQWMESPVLPELTGAHRHGCTASWRPKLALGDVLGEQSSGCSPPAGQEGCCEGTRRNCSTSEPRGESWDRLGHTETGWDPAQQAQRRLRSALSPLRQGTGPRGAEPPSFQQPRRHQGTRSGCAQGCCSHLLQWAACSARPWVQCRTGSAAVGSESTRNCRVKRAARGRRKRAQRETSKSRSDATGRAQGCGENAAPCFAIYRQIAARLRQ